MSTFLEHQLKALQRELSELVELGEHSVEILDTLLEKSTELDLDDRKYISLINQELKTKLNKLKILNNGK
jgi:hypothetical protein